MPVDRPSDEDLTTPLGDGGSVGPHGAIHQSLADAINDLEDALAVHTHGAVYQLTSQKDLASGYAGLDASGKLSTGVLPATLTTDAELTAAVAAHVADGADAHIASAVTVDDSAFSTIVASTVQEALDWLDDNGGGGGGGGSAASVTFSPTGSVAATNVQAAIVEVASEYAAADTAHAAASDPHAGYQKESEKGSAGGYASLDGSGDVPDAQIASAIARVASAVMDGDAAGGGLTGTYPNPTVADNHIGNNRLADRGPLSVIGRSANSTGDPADISATAGSGAVLRESGSTLGFGTVATAGIADDAITDAKLRNSAGMSVIGRAGGASGDPGDIVATANGQVLGRRSGALTFEQVQTGDIADLAVSFAKIQQISSGRLVGRTSAGAGAFEEILIGSGLSLSGLTLSATGGGSFDPAMGGDLSGLASAAQIVAGAVGDTELRDSAALSVIGRASNTSGDPADITAGTDGYVLRRSGTTLGFGQIALGAIPDGLITLAKHANVATGRILGRDTAGFGAPEELTVGGGVEFTGSGGIQRSALTGDVTAAAGSGATTIAQDAVTFAKLQNSSAAGVLLGRQNAGGAGDFGEITLGSGLVMTGAVLSASGGGGGDPVMGGDLSGLASAAQIVANAVGNPELRDSGALSVIGRNANSVGDPADISAVAGSGAVLRESGNILGFGTVATAGIADAAITDAKLRNSLAISVLGRSVNSAGAPADIAATVDGQVLRRSGTTLGFGTIGAASIDNDAITYAKIQNVTSARLLGRSTAGSGDVEELQVGTGLSLASGVLSATGAAAALDAMVVEVCSNDMPTAVKNAVLARGGFVCDGVDDHVQINQAIIKAAPLVSRNAGIPAGAEQRGVVQLSGGEFNIHSAILMYTAVWLRGMGRLTIIQPGGAGSWVDTGAGSGSALIKKATVDEHLLKVSDLMLDGGSSGSLTTKPSSGIHYNGNGADGSGYPGASDPWDQFGPNLWLRNFQGATTRHGIWLETDERGCMFRNVIGRDIGGNGIYIDSSADGHISDCKMGALVGAGFYIAGGNYRITNCKSWYADAYGYRLQSGRGQISNCEAQDCGTGFFFDGSPFIGDNLTADTCLNDGILVSSSRVRLGNFQIFNRGNGRYPTTTNGIRWDGAYTDGIYVGGSDPGNTTNLITGTLPTAANRNFARVSNGSGTSLALSVG